MSYDSTTKEAAELLRAIYEALDRDDAQALERGAARVRGVLDAVLHEGVRLGNAAKTLRFLSERAADHGPEES